MDNNALFIQASRRQLLFSTTKGFLTVNDLWSQSLKTLDTIAQSIAAGIKPKNQSFLSNPDAKADAATADNQLRLDILVFVITTLEAENKAERAAGEARKQREFLKSLLDRKKIASLENLTEAEIQAQLDALGQ